jgi:carbamoyl-phosphate synthase large subunit
MSSGQNNNILLTSAGSLVGRTVISCLEDTCPQFRLIGTNSIPDEPYLQKLDALYLIPESSNNESIFIEKILSLIDQLKPVLVIPCRDEDILLLSTIAEKYSHLKDRILCGSSLMSKVMLDKWESYLFSRENGLPFAQSSLCDNEVSTSQLIEKCGFPIIIKPRKGFASRQVTIAFDENQLRMFSSNNAMMFQEYIGENQGIINFLEDIKFNGVPLFFSFEAEKIAIQTYINRNGTINDIFATTHNMKNGMSMIANRYNQSDAIDLGQKTAECFSRNGWRGPLNIQCAKDNFDKLKIYEFNGRFTGATALRLSLGYDELLFALKDKANIAFSRSKYQQADRSFRREIIMSIDPSWMQELKTNGFLVK